jgi:hypothetical protein
LQDKLHLKLLQENLLQDKLHHKLLQGKPLFHQEQLHKIMEKREKEV